MLLIVKLNPNLEPLGYEDQCTLEGMPGETVTLNLPK